jgi:hypothetical protein
MRPVLLLAALLVAAPAASAPSPAASPLDHLPALKGDYFSIASRATGTTYHIYIRLPLDYAEQPARRYPLITLLDGDSAFPLLAPQHLFMTIDDQTPEAILVGIAYGGFGPVNRRSHDFGEGAPAFQRFLAEERLFEPVAAGTRAGGRVALVSGTRNNPDARNKALAWHQRHSTAAPPWTLRRFDIGNGTHAADLGRAYRLAVNWLLDVKEPG